MNSFSSYKNKPASEKITLAIMDAAKRLVAFELDAGATALAASGVQVSIKILGGV